jgi:molybdate transport system substrate-binding protein
MTTMTRRPALILLALLPGCARPTSANLTVSVAASLQTVMQEVAAKYSPARIDLNFGASGALAQQIATGAPADVFFCASSKSMDELASRRLLFEDTRRNLLRNEIVLIAPAVSRVNSFEALTSAAVKVVAVGEPESVPAGEYGRQTLISMGLWDRIQPKLVFAKDVRQVLAYVATGNADAGIVYATDARTSAEVRVVSVAPPQAHDAILYPVAVIKGSHHAAAARAFTAYLAGPEARAVFEAGGFTSATP